MFLFTHSLWIKHQSFQTIHFCVLRKLNGSKYSYESVIIELNISHLLTQLNVQTVLFQTIQFSMSTKLNGSKYCYVSLTIELNTSHLFTHS